MEQNQCLRLQQVLSFCVTSVTSEVALPPAASTGFRTGMPVTVQAVQATVDSVDVGLGDSAKVTLNVGLTLRIGRQNRTAALRLTQFLQLAGLHCSGTTVSVQVRKAWTGPLTVDGESGALRLPGQEPGGQFGFALAVVGDVDGDGWAELAVGAPSTAPGGVPESGSVYLYSLRTGSLLWRSDSPDPRAEFGFAVSGCGDINGDGIPDLVVGAIQASPGGMPGAGSAFVLSGADGSVIRRHDGEAAFNQFGWSVATAGDIDGDGVTDYAIGAPSADPGGLTDAGSVYVYSGATGLLLHRLDGLAAEEAFGFTVALVSDLDGDGVPDLAAGAITASPPLLPQAGVVRVYNKTAALILTAEGSQAEEGFGWSIADVGDWNGDGTPDFLVGAPSTVVAGQPQVGTTYVISGATGAVLTQLKGTQAYGAQGAAVAAAGGLPLQIAVSAPDTNENGVLAAGSVAVTNEAGTVAARFSGDQVHQDWGWALAGLRGVAAGVSGVAMGVPLSNELAGTAAGLVVVQTLGGGAHFPLALCLEWSAERPVVIDTRGAERICVRRPSYASSREW